MTPRYWGYWERRGSSIYEESDNGEPGTARLIAELHPANIESVQIVVDEHNFILDEETKAA